MIYLDNAATTFPKPRSVLEASTAALKKYGANPGRSGHKLSLDTAMEIYRARNDISDLFGATGPENVVFTMNCTHAINLVLKGLLKTGDHVVVSCLEHNSIIRPLHALSRIGVTFTEAIVHPGDHNATINEFRNALTERTALIACTHASNVWGLRLPIARISALSHQYGIPILVDAAQSAGVLPINMAEMEIDYLCAAGHKGLYGPMGTGLLLARDFANLSPIIEGGTGTNSISYTQPETPPDKLESGTPNVPGICALGAGVRFIQNVGLSAIAKHEYTLISRLYDQLSSIDAVQLYMPRPTPEFFVPLLSFNLKGKDSEVTADFLDKNGVCVRAGLHCSPCAHRFAGTIDSGTVRVCPSYFSKLSDINRLSFLVKKFATIN